MQDVMNSSFVSGLCCRRTTSTKADVGRRQQTLDICFWGQVYNVWGHMWLTSEDFNLIENYDKICT